MQIGNSGLQRYPGFIEYCNTPSPTGTVPRFERVLPLFSPQTPMFGPVVGLPVSDHHVAVFLNAANLGKRRGSCRLCLSFFQVAQVFFALGQNITYLSDNASSILLREPQNRFQGSQVKCFSFQRPFPVLIVLSRPSFIHIGDIVHRAIGSPNKDIIQFIPEN